MDNKWHVYNKSDTVFVFVHGFLSNNIDCWRNKKNNVYFPDLVNSVDFDNPSIFLAGYHTGISENNFDINQCAIQLRRNLSLTIDGNKTPLDFDKIIFVCHSLGGIVSRILLCKFSDLFKNKKIGFALIASPALGSSYADKLKVFSNLLGNDIAKQLKSSNEILMKFDIDFISILNSKKDFEIMGVEACEQNGPIKFKWFPFVRIKPIVESLSASRYFGEKQIIPKTDHFSIAKPESKESDIFKFLLFFYRDKFKGKSERSFTVKPDPLFDIYSSEHCQFYLTRSIDSKLERFLEYKSLWIYGISGVGKTSIAKFAANKFCGKPCEIHLGHLDVNQDETDLLIEIISTIDPDGVIDSKKGLHQKLVRLISEKSEDNVYIIFDEVPISSSCSNEKFIFFISNLLDAVRQTKKSNVRFIICSINRPNFNCLTDKVIERFEILEVDLWPAKDLNNLAELIINELQCVNIDRDSLIEHSNGLPRHLKNSIKDVFFEKI